MKKTMLYLWILSIGVSGLSAELVYKNRETVLILVEDNSHKLDWNKLDEVYKKDREIVLKAIGAGHCIIDDLDDVFQKDKKIVTLSLQKNACAIKDDKKVAPKNIPKKKLSAFSEEELKKKLKKEKQVKERLATDKEYVLAKLEKGYFNLSYLSSINPEFLKDEEVVWAYLSCFSTSLSNIDESFLKDSKFIEKIIKRRGRGLKYATSEQQDNRTLVLHAVKQNKENFKYASQRLKNDKSLLLENKYIFEYMGYSVKQDRESALRASLSFIYNFAHVSNALKKDKDFLLQFIEKSNSLYGNYWEHFDSSLKKDRELIFAYAKKYSRLIDILDKELQEDKAFLAEYINKIGYGLKYATAEQQDNRTLVLRLIIDNYKDFQYASERLKNDKSFFLNNKSLFKYMGERVKQDREIALMACKASFSNLEHLPSKLKKDKKFLLQVIKSSVYSSDWKYIDDSLKKDKEVIFVCAKKDKKLIDELVKELQEDKAFVTEYINKIGYGLKYATAEQQDNRTLVLRLIIDNYKDFQYASERLKNDKSLFLNNKSLFKYMGDSVKQNREIALMACKDNSDNWQYLSSELKKDKEFLLQFIKKSNYLYGNGNHWEYFDSFLKKDRELIFAYAKKDGTLIERLDKELRENELFVTEYINKIGYGLKYATVEQQDNRKFVLFVLKYYNYNHDEFKYASQRLKNDKSLLLENKSIFKYMGDSVKKDQKSAFIACTHYFPNWQYLPDALKKDKNFLLQVIENSNSIYSVARYNHNTPYRDDWVQQIDNSFKKDREVIFAYAKTNKHLIDILDKELKEDKAFVTEYINKIGYGLEYATSEQQDNKTLVLKHINYREFRYVSEKLKRDKSFIMEALKVNPNIFENIYFEFQQDEEVLALMEEIKKYLKEVI